MSKETNQESKKNKISIRPEQESKKQIRNLGLGLIIYTTRFLRK